MCYPGNLTFAAFCAIIYNIWGVVLRTPFPQKDFICISMN